MQGIFVGRQPIFDRNTRVIGYELLYRTYGATSANVTDGDSATSQVILNTFLEIGLDRLVGNGLAFINLTRAFILKSYPIPFVSDKVVLEILEDITIDNEIITALNDLSERGYTIALDDVVDPATVRPLLHVAKIIKLDLLGIPEDKLAEYAMLLRRRRVKLLAEKVETLEMFEKCKELGFDYFQGFFLSKPNIVEGHRMPESRMNILRLLSRLQAPNVEFTEIEEIIRNDVAISYKLLRLINSTFFGRRMKISSPRQALTLLGIRQIQDWVSLLFLAKIEDKPRELMVTAMVRARMSASLAEALNARHSETGFTVGLFSVLDALLDQPLETILAELPLSEDVSRALLAHEGQLGGILACILAYERGDWDNSVHPLLKTDAIRDAYLAAVEWTNNIAPVLMS